MTFNLEFVKNMLYCINTFKTDYDWFINSLKIENNFSLETGLEYYERRTELLVRYLLGNVQQQETITEKYLGVGQIPKDVSARDAFCVNWFLIECLHPLISRNAHKDNPYLSTYFIGVLELSLHLYNLSDEWDHKQAKIYERDEYTFFQKSYEGIVSILTESNTLYGNTNILSINVVGESGKYN